MEVRSPQHREQRGERAHREGPHSGRVAGARGEAGQQIAEPPRGEGVHAARLLCVKIAAGDVEVGGRDLQLWRGSPGRGDVTAPHVTGSKVTADMCCVAGRAGRQTLKPHDGMETAGACPMHAC